MTNQIKPKGSVIIRQSLNEIKNVIENHGYSINIIICDIINKFNFKTICYKSGASSVKEDGYSVAEMKKDVLYRLKNNEILKSDSFRLFLRPRHIFY